MTAPNFNTRLPLLALLLCGSFAASTWAGPTTDRGELAELAARHRAERAACLNVQETEARGDCLRDTDAAYGHAKRNRASDIAPPFAKNAILRCEALRGEENRDCLARMDGQGTTSGSVAGGGIYRELVVIEAAAPPASVTTPMAPVVAPMPPLVVPTSPAVPPAATQPSATNPTTPK